MISQAELDACLARRQDLLTLAARERFMALAARPESTGGLSRRLTRVTASLCRSFTSLLRSPERQTVRAAAMEQHGGMA